MSIRKNKLRSFLKATIIILLILLSTFFLYLFLNSYGLLKNISNTRDSAIGSERIVSFGPSITETVYALGLEDRLVGNTDYCKYPEAAKSITKIGAHADMNYELLMALNVDKAIVYSWNDKHKSVLENLGIKYLVVDHSSIKSIMQSITDIGSEFGKDAEAKLLLDNITRRVEVATCDNKSYKPRVLLVVHRDIDFGGMSNITVVGSDIYFRDLIDLAGGINVFGEANAAYPIIDMEAVVRSNPDIIIEILVKYNEKDLSLKNWLKVQDINAVKNGAVHFFNVEDASIPGPRFVDTLEKMTSIICSR